MSAEQTVLEAAPERVSPLALSHSRVSMLAGCGEKYRLSYIERVPQEPQGWFLGGRAVHEAISLGITEDLLVEVWEPGNAMELYFGEAFDREVKNAGGMDIIRWGGRASKQWPGGEDAEWWKAEGPIMISRANRLLYGEVAQGAQGFDGKGSEVKVTAETPHGLLTCYIDLLWVTADGELIVRDFKTGRPGGGNPMQLETYAYVIQQTLGHVVSRGELIHLRASTAADGIETFELHPENVERRLESYAAIVQAGAFLPNPSSFCSSCYVREHCEFGGRA